MKVVSFKNLLQLLAPGQRSEDNNPLVHLIILSKSKQRVDHLSPLQEAAEGPAWGTSLCLI